uniref:LOB domain-containing protein n=1 Tax=Oryza brachyantha TaxID=4533 RepID=J3LQT2_ORYBR
MSSSSSPCAACKLLRRKCTQGCVFAPYFPPDQPAKFANVHKVFGASNVTKLLNDLQPDQREDAVNSLAYEAEARLRGAPPPVYGCVAYISILQLRIKQVREQIVEARKELAAYIGPTAFAPLVAAAPHPHQHYLPSAAAEAHGQYHLPGTMGVPIAGGSFTHQVQHQMAGLQVQHPQHHHHLLHHQQQMVNAQHMASAVEVARDPNMERILRARQVAYAQANATTVAVEAPSGSLNADAFHGGSFLLHHQQQSSAQTEPAMALPFRVEPPPPQPSSGHSHDEVSQQQHHHHPHHHRHHHHTDGTDERFFRLL